VDETLAAAVIAEVGVGMRVFENVSQLASRAGVCLGNNESAGKRKSRIPKAMCISRLLRWGPPIPQPKPRALT
jgi:hypothetical protein